MTVPDWAREQVGVGVQRCPLPSPLRPMTGRPVLGRQDVEFSLEALAERREWDALNGRAFQKTEGGMSYDIWVGHSDEPGNITYNVDAMFALALGEPEAGVRNGADVVFHLKSPALKRFVDRPASEAIEPLRAAVARMEADPEAYRALNPPNGWGDYEGALDYLRRFLEACEEKPERLVEGWL